MPIKTYITDTESGLEPAVDNCSGDEKRALVVATRPLKTYGAKVAFAINPTYGMEMAQNGLFGGTALAIHDGTDSVAWTFSEPTGTKWEADSTDRAYAGTKALKCDNPNVGDVLQVINNLGPGNDIDLTGNYVGITMWINVDKDWAGGDSIEIYAHLDGALAGNAVALEDYFAYDSYDTWQFISIPLSDMGLTTSSIDAFRIENISREGGKSPEFYIDEWEMQESGEAIDFEITPDDGTWFHIKSFQTTFVDAYSADNDDSTVPNLAYNQILGMTPTVGYLFRRYSEEVIQREARIKCLMDLLSLPTTQIADVVSDGTNTMVTIENTYPESVDFVLKSEDDDKIVYTLEDNFSQLLYFRISAIGYTEER